jgi:tight adherence protein C
MTALHLHISLLCLLALFVGTLVAVLSGIRPVLAPSLGHRGLLRNKAIQGGGIFAAAEPLIRYCAAPIALLPLRKTRAKVERMLLHSDSFLGLSVDELLSVSALSAVSLGGSASLFALALELPPAIAIFAAALGGALPFLQIQEVIRQRIKVVSRGLPHAIEIAAMCMGAGLDFPGAIRMLTNGNNEQNALNREFAVILEHLRLGRTRREALLNFAERVPTPAVRDFVSAVIQSEQKGNPLARVLQIQGRVLNTRRSVAAEEAAARAGVLMLVPMMLLVGCILLLLMGPFAVSGIGI